MYRQACASLLRAGRSLACEAATSSQSCVVAQAAACTSTTLRPGPWYTAARTVMAAVHSSAPAAGTLGQARWYSSAASLSTLSPGHRKRRKRRARGGGDKQAGRGRDGQKSRSGTGKPALFFEGGQTPFWKRLPKRGFHNRFSYEYDNVLVTELDAYVRMGKLDPRNVITMKHMYDAGLLEKKAYNRNGVALLNKRPSAWKRARLEAAVGYALPESLEYPIEVEVATVSEPARATIEGRGGRVHKVFYNKLGMRALLVPEWFEKKGRLLPGPASIVPYKKQWRYDGVGTIPATQRPAMAQL